MSMVASISDPIAAMPDESGATVTGAYQPLGRDMVGDD